MGRTRLGRETSRRTFLRSAVEGSLLVAGGALAIGCQLREIESAADLDLSRVRLGLDTYTVHRSLTAKDPNLKRDLWSLIDELEGLGLDGLQIDPSHFPGDDPRALERLEERTRKDGYYVEFGMGGWDPKRLVERARLTARFGGRAVRTFCGDQKTSQEDLKNYVNWAVPAFREAAEAIDGLGVAIAVENHGDVTSAQLKELLDRVGHPLVGACLDTGNSLFRKEDPLRCARTLAPYTTSMHLKDWTLRFDGAGEPQWNEAVPGEGEVPVEEILHVVLAEQPELYIALENPVRPGPDDRETVAREWNHLVASAAAARRILKRIRGGKEART